MKTASAQAASDNRKWFRKGILGGIPIGLGYFAVAFAVGITAHDIGMSGPQAFIMSAGMMASAGEYAALELLGSGAGIFEIIMTCLIVNLRYFLMSCALTQKLKPDEKKIHSFGLAYCITDEIFALSSMVEGRLNPFYTYGIDSVSVAGWSIGTVVGLTAGNILPGWAVNALSVALFGMFLAVIIPPAKKDRFIALLVAISMACSLVFTEMPVLKNISSGFRIIILTLLIAGIAALIRPVDDESSPDAVCSDRGNGKEVR